MGYTGFYDFTHTNQHHLNPSNHYLTTWASILIIHTLSYPFPSHLHQCIYATSIIPIYFPFLKNSFQFSPILISISSLFNHRHLTKLCQLFLPATFLLSCAYGPLCHASVPVTITVWYAQAQLWPK